MALIMAIAITQIISRATLLIVLKPVDISVVWLEKEWQPYPVEPIYFM